MLSENDINNFFISKHDIEVSILNCVIELKLPNGVYAHSCNAPSTLEELDTLYNKTKNDLLLKDEKFHSVKKDNKAIENGVIVENKKCGGCHSNSSVKNFVEKEIEARDNKTWGLINLSKAVISGEVSNVVRNYRFQTCLKCEIRDIDGARLFREEDGIYFCGIPRLSELAKIKRDERHWGCGCELEEKIRYIDSECPFKVW